MGAQLDAGFHVNDRGDYLTAWGPDLAAAFEAAMTGVLQSAGADPTAAPTGRSETIQVTGENPAAVLDNIGLQVSARIDDGEKLDGSISVGGIIHGDDGWIGWAAIGLGDEESAPINNYEFAVPPRVERKVGRVNVKINYLIMDRLTRDRLTELLRQTDRLIQDRALHPGGVVGPLPGGDDDVNG